jgi:hypothetical protein
MNCPATQLTNNKSPAALTNISMERGISIYLLRFFHLYVPPPVFLFSYMLRVEMCTFLKKKRVIQVGYRPVRLAENK